MTKLAEEPKLPNVLEKATDGISVADAAKRMGVTRATVLYWIKAGRLPSATQFGGGAKRGGRWRIDPDDLEQMRRGA